LKAKIGPFQCRLLDVSNQCNLSLTSSEIDSLKKFEKYLFQNLLEMKLNLADILLDTPYVVAPFEKGMV